MFRRTPRPDYYSLRYYESSYSDLHSVSEHERKALVLLGIQANDVILDVGCGRGTLLREVAQMCQWAVGVDYSWAAVNIAKMNIEALKMADIIRASATYLPFRDMSFNKVSMLEVLEHLDKKDSILAIDEVYRVLKNGGKSIISTPYVEFPISLLSRIYRIMTRSIFSSLHVDEKSIRRIKRLMYKFSNKFILIGSRGENAKNWRDKLITTLKYPHPKLSGQLTIISYKAGK